MPTYVFENNNTGEVTEVSLRISQLDEYRESNPDLRLVPQAPQIISQSQSTMRKAGKDWENLLDGIKKKSGKGNTVNT